jgi:hypothetical protein
LNPARNETDILRTPFFPSDVTFYNNFQSEDFKRFLVYDGTTKKGRNNIAKYYNVSDEWKLLDHDVDFVTDYYQLLLLVKTSSDNDKLWMSFIEGLHRHAAIILCLLCAKFDNFKNILIPDSLSIQDFKNSNIPHFNMPHDSLLTPKDLLNHIVENNESTSSMLTTPITVNAYYPNNNTCDSKILMDYCKKLSAKISTNKRDSAIKSISNEISTGLVFIKAHKTSAKIKQVDKHMPGFGVIMKYQSHIAWNKLEKTIKTSGNDHSTGYPELLRSSEYEKYCRDPYNDGNRESFIEQIPLSGKSKKKKEIVPPYLLSFKGLTEINDYDKTSKSRSIDPSHVNAYFIVPILVHGLTTKLNNENILNLAEKNINEEVNMIKFVTRYAYGMKKSPNVLLHGAIKHYCPNANESQFIQGLTGLYRVIPVTLFLTTLYNASFAFNTKNTSNNLLVTALQRFDLKFTVCDEMFLNTMSKSITSASFSKIEIRVIFIIFYKLYY